MVTVLHKKKATITIVYLAKVTHYGTLLNDGTRQKRDLIFISCARFFTGEIRSKNCRLWVQPDFRDFLCGDWSW
jgi:hypothetical protein